MAKFTQPKNKTEALELITNVAEEFDINSREITMVVTDDKHVTSGNIFVSYIGMAFLFLGLAIFFGITNFASEIVRGIAYLVCSIPLYFLGTKLIGVRSKSILAIPIIAVAMFLQTSGIITGIELLDLEYDWFMSLAAVVAILTAAQQYYFATQKGSSYLMSVAIFYFVVAAAIVFMIVGENTSLPVFTIGVSLFLLGRHFKKTVFTVLTGVLDFFGSILFFIGSYGIILGDYSSHYSGTFSLESILITLLSLGALWFGAVQKSRPILFASLVSLIIAIVALIDRDNLGAAFGVAIIVIGAVIYIFSNMRKKASTKKQQS